jgi:hypothetical protein
MENELVTMSENFFLPLLADCCQQIKLQCLSLGSLYSLAQCLPVSSELLDVAVKAWQRQTPQLILPKHQ